MIRQGLSWESVFELRFEWRKGSNFKEERPRWREQLRKGLKEGMSMESSAGGRGAEVESGER